MTETRGKIIKVETDWFERSHTDQSRVIQLTRDALLIAQNEEMDWFDFFVNIGGKIKTKEINPLLHGEMICQWKNAYLDGEVKTFCKIKIQVYSHLLKDAETFENGAVIAAFSPIRAN